MTADLTQSDIHQSQQEKAETMEGGQHFPRTIKPCKHHTIAKSATLVPLMRMPTKRILNQIAIMAKSTAAKSVWVNQRRFHHQHMLSIMLSCAIHLLSNTWVPIMGHSTIHDIWRGAAQRRALEPLAVGRIQQQPVMWPTLERRRPAYVRDWRSSSPELAAPLAGRTPDLRLPPPALLQAPLVQSRPC